MKLVAALICLLATSAAAKCKYLDCLCDGPHSWIVKVQATSATSGTVREVFAGTPSDGGSSPSVGAAISFSGVQVSSGDFVLVDETGAAFPLANGGATASCSNVSVPADDWARSLADGTCSSTLGDAGFEQPDCNDRGPCGCSSVSGAAAALVLLIRAVWRRR